VFKVVTLCGSTRFKDEFRLLESELTLKGYIVISLGNFTHVDNKILDDSILVILTAMHKQKMDMADEIYVVNKDKYIGNATKDEIAYAISIGKKISYMY